MEAILKYNNKQSGFDHSLNSHFINYIISVKEELVLKFLTQTEKPQIGRLDVSGVEALDVLLLQLHN